jgi:hypothetical protein
VISRAHKRTVSQESPLREVVQQLAKLQKQLDTHDDEIAKLLRHAEEIIRARRSTGGPVGIPFPPWGKLAWSGRRGFWRLVVIDDEECEELLSMPRECRMDACHVLHKLVERMELL